MYFLLHTYNRQDIYIYIIDVCMNVCIHLCQRSRFAYVRPKYDNFGHAAYITVADPQDFSAPLCIAMSSW